MNGQCDKFWICKRKLVIVMAYVSSFPQLRVVLMLLAMVYSSCKTFSDQEATNASSLKGVYDSFNILRLVAADYPGSPYAAGVYTFQICKSYGDPNCTFAFLNAAKQPVPVRIDLIPNQDLTAAERAYLKSVNTEYQKYASAIRSKKMRQAGVKSYEDEDREVLVTTAVGGGAYVFGKSLAAKRGVGLERLEKDLRTLERQMNMWSKDVDKSRFMIRGLLNHPDGTPEQVAKSLIDREVSGGKGVFDEDLIKWLDAEGLPAPLRSWLRHNKLSIDHYLLDPENFMKFILSEDHVPADQLKVFKDIAPEFPEKYFPGGRDLPYKQRSRVFDWASSEQLRAHYFDENVISPAMKQYLVKQHGKIDGSLLFKAGLRERIVQSILSHNKVGSEQHLELLQRANPYPKGDMINYYLGLDDAHNIGSLAWEQKYMISGVPNYKLRQGFAQGITHQQKAFLAVRYHFGRSSHFGYRSLSRISDWREAAAVYKQTKVEHGLLANYIDELESGSIIKLGRRVGDLSGVPKNRSALGNGILGFMAKRHRVGAAVAGTIAAVAVTFSTKKLAEAKGKAAAELTLATDGADLILDGSSLLWKTEHEGAEDYEEVSDMQAVLDNIIRFQHNLWLDDEDDLAEVKIAYTCWASASADTHCVQVKHKDNTHVTERY